MKKHVILVAGLLTLGLSGCMPAAQSPHGTAPNWTVTPGPAGTAKPQPLISATGQPIKMALTPRFAVQEGDVFGGVELVGQMGVWVLRSDRTRADVDGLKVEGRRLREPVNVIMVDLFAKTPQEALLRVTAALGGVGLNPADSLTHGYQAYLNGEFAPEVPAGQTFARGLGTAREERLRLFGPWKYGEGYVFLAGIAAEHIGGEGRAFSDFMVSREDLAAQLGTRTVFRKKGYVDVLSKVDTPSETTADHDGCAVVFVARE